MMGIRMPETC